MKHSLGMCGLLCAGLTVAAPMLVLAADLTVTSAVAITSPATYDNVTVTGTGVLTVDAPLTVNSNMTVQSGGVVTHSLRLVSGLVLNVSGTLNVQNGGSIDASGKGLRGGGAGSSFGNAGEAYDPTGTTIVSGATSVGNAGAGGSFGGVGATGSTGSLPGAAYGFVESANLLGAGGSRGGTFAGGHGGGRVTITAGNLVVDGLVAASGGNGSGPTSGMIGGGGSGGSIHITVTGTFSGASTANIQVVGGNGNTATNSSGSGGGGRMVVHYGTMTYPQTNLHVRGGTVGRIGGAGTLYLKGLTDATGDLLVDNNAVVSGIETPLRTALMPPAFRLVRVFEAGILGVSASDVVSGTLTMSRLRVEATSTFNARTDLALPLGSELELVGGALAILNGSAFTIGTFDASNAQSGAVNITTGSRLDVTANVITVGPGVSLVKDGAFGATDEIGSMTVQSGGVVTHSLRLVSGLVLNVIGTLDVQSGGLIDVNAKGLRGGDQGSSFGSSGEAYDPTGTTIIAGAALVGQAGAGASYGGTGATSSTGAASNAPYGVPEAPQHLGSGGAGASDSPVGGHGGGRITLTAGVLSVNGTIRANGGNGTGPSLGNVAGGGSGGAIRVTVIGALSGSGMILAAGGSAPCNLATCGGSGSGGRIAIYHCNNYLPAANVAANGGAGTRPGAPGTVYYQHTDVPPPALTVPDPVAAFTGPGATGCSAVVSDAAIGTATAIPHCPGGMTIVRNGVPAGNLFPVGTTLITWTATDDQGGASMATQAITVSDNTVPAISAPAALILSADTGACDLLATSVSLGTATASDNCSATTITSDAPGTFPAGPTTVTWTATDSFGNVATATQLVTIVDQEDPTVSAPETVLAVARATSCDVVVPDDSLGVATAHDNCLGVSVARSGVPDGNLFPLGTTTLTYTATDAAGRTGSATQVVVVVDGTPPLVTAPGNLELIVGPGAGPCQLTANPGVAQATDNCSVPTVQVDVMLTDGSVLFTEGITTLVWTATDAAGNSGTATQQVSVRCPLGDITGTVMSCNGVNPLPGVSLQLLYVGDLVAAATTNTSGVFRFDDVRLGTYTVVVVPPEGFAIEIDTRLVQLLDEDQALAMDPFVLTCSERDLAGRVEGSCSGGTAGLLGITVDLYRDDGSGTHVLVGTTVTDAQGGYAFEGLALGEYFIAVVTPLGYSGTSTQTVTLAPGSEPVAAATFTLACQVIAAQPRSMGYWKHQVNVYLTGKGSAQETLANLLHYIDELVVHFNENLVNPVIVYVPGAASTQDKLLQLQQLLTVNRGGTMLDRTKQQLLALLLNVVSGKISQTEVISDNGATVSQAITHSHDLIVDGLTSNDETAKTICDLINNGQRVPSGVVPAGTRVITYELKPGGPTALVALALGPIAPNPATFDATITFALPSDAPAVLEIHDLAGRLVVREQVGSRGVGIHTFRLAEVGRMRPGIYLVRLLQAGVAKSLRLAVIR